MKKILLSILISMSFGLTSSAMERPEAAASNRITLQENEFQASEKLGDIQLIHENKNFSVIKDGVTYPVQNAFLDKKLRGMERVDLLWVLGRSDLDRANDYDIEYSNDLYIFSQEELDRIDLEMLDFRPVTPEEQVKIDECARILLTKRAAYVRVTELGPGEYKLVLKMRLKGGGAFGAWAGAWLGCAVVNIGSQVLISCVSMPVSLFCTPLVGSAVHIGLTNAVAPVVLAASCSVALGTGVVAGIATGPM